MLDHRKNIPSLRAVTMPERATSQKARESWQLWGIISEFVEATERLSEIRPAVSIFGSARTRPGTPQYELTVEIARKLSDAGFRRHQRRRPGDHGGRKQGRVRGRVALGRAEHRAAVRAVAAIAYQDISLRFSHFFARKVAFVKYAAAYVVMPGGFRHARRTQRGADADADGQGQDACPWCWSALPSGAACSHGCATTLAAEGMIDTTDLDMMRVVDDSDAVVNALFDFYDARGFAQTRERAGTTALPVTTLRTASETAVSERRWTGRTSTMGDDVTLATVSARASGSRWRARLRRRRPVAPALARVPPTHSQRHRRQAGGAGDDQRPATPPAAPRTRIELPRVRASGA